MGGTSASDGDDEELSRPDKDLEKRIQNTLWDDKNNPFHTEFEGDYEASMQERDYLSEKSMNPWDLLVPQGERATFRTIFSTIPFEARKACPYLFRGQTPDAVKSSCFLFCDSDARLFRGPRPSKENILPPGHPLRQPIVGGIEDQARVFAYIVEDLCFGNTKRCQVYNEEISGERQKLMDLEASEE